MTVTISFRLILLMVTLIKCEDLEFLRALLLILHVIYQKSTVWI